MSDTFGQEKSGKLHGKAFHEPFTKVRRNPWLLREMWEMLLSAHGACKKYTPVGSGPLGPLGCKSGLQNLVRKRKLHGGRSLRRLHVDPPLTSAHVGDLPASLHGVAAHGEGESNGLRTTAESESNFLPVTQRQNDGYNELFKEAPKHQKRDCKNKKMLFSTKYRKTQMGKKLQRVKSLRLSFFF